MKDFEPTARVRAAAPESLWRSPGGDSGSEATERWGQNGVLGSPVVALSARPSLAQQRTREKMTLLRERQDKLAKDRR